MTSAALIMPLKNSLVDVLIYSESSFGDFGGSAAYTPGGLYSENYGYLLRIHYHKR